MIKREIALPTPPIIDKAELSTPFITSPNFCIADSDIPIDLLNSSQLAIIEPNTTTNAPKPVPINAVLNLPKPFEDVLIAVVNLPNDLIPSSIALKPCVTAIKPCILAIAWSIASDSTPIACKPPATA